MNIRKIKIFFCFILVFGFVELLAQYEITDISQDSIVKIEKAIINSSNRIILVDNYINLAKYYIFFDLQKSVSILDSISSISNQEKYTRGIIESYYLKGEYEKLIGNLENSKLYYEKGIELAQIANNDTLIAFGYNSYGKMLIDLLHLNDAYQNLKNGLIINDKLDNKRGIGLSNLYLGRLMFWFDDTEQAIDYYKKSEKFFKEENIFSLYGLAKIFIGEAFIKLKKTDSSFIYLNSAIQISKENKLTYINYQANRYILSYYFHINDITKAISHGLKIIQDLRSNHHNYFEGDIYTLISHGYQTLEKLDSALYYNVKALESRKATGSKAMIASSFINIGDSYMRLGNFRNAKTYIDSSITLSIVSGKYLYSSSGYKKLAVCYEELNDKPNALIALKNYVKYKEILEKEQRISEMAILESKYQREKFELDNKRSLLKEKENSLYITSFIAILFVIIALLSSLLLIRKRKDNNELQIKQVELNNTLELLNESQEELITLNRELEQRVEERTDDLRAEINRRKIAEENLIQTRDNILNSYEKEKELNKLKSDLINMISHEYRTPLAVIASSADLLRFFDKNKDTDKYNRQLEKISQAITRMTSLIDNVFTFENIKTIQDNSNFVEIDFVVYLKEIVDELTIQQKNQFEFSFVSNKDTIIVFADERMLWHICMNLISNAVKYTSFKKEIIITVNEFNTFITFSVKDFGIGIPENDLKHIFDPFYRATNSGFIQGTGFGLTIAKNFVELMNGEISIKSAVNQGTEVQVNFKKHPQLL